nr:uncharacterized protein LOC104110923 [Nicotiana tomentosiformis]
MYAKCRSNLRKELWANLVNFSVSHKGPWAIIGDFNVISDHEENNRGNPYRIDKSFDFLECLTECGLQDAGFLGNIVTWYNNRVTPDTIWKRLDRMVYNSEWFSLFGRTTVTHLASACSDHVPLLAQFCHIEETYVKYFKFLNFWTEHVNFLDVVKNTWEEECQGNPLWILHQKLKKTASRLSSWYREAYGDIHEESKRLELEISNFELLTINDNSDVNRTNLNKIRAEYFRYLKIHDSILRQKARVKWLTDGDSNTAYFHNVIKDKRRTLRINKIHNKFFQWVEGTKEVSEAAVRYFRGLFSQKHEQNDFFNLDIIKHAISEDVNHKLIALPTAKKFQTCWSIVASNIVQSFISIFYGAELPRWFTHTCIVMLPKVPSPQHFNDIRPISLCNVISKLFAKLPNSRLSIILPDLISWNQSGFVKGRAITENILLAQEIIQDIGKPNEKGNIILKLDMAKAYDRVSWSYLCVLKRQLGFCETWIDIIFRHISSNWYSLLANGTRQAFFKSERGLRQEDPISPSLFVICAEHLSRKLNLITSLDDYKGFHMNKNGPLINHLVYVDDIILFSSGCRKSLILLMEALTGYEKISGQLVNKQKSCVILAPNTPPDEISRVEGITQMEHKVLPIKYLGCPLYVGRKKIFIFSEMITKVINKISGWHSKFFSTGGRAVLIRHVLMALPTHLLAAIHPPKGDLNQIKRVLNRFFWRGSAEKKRYHWASWDNLYFPYEEGDLDLLLPPHVVDKINNLQIRLNPATPDDPKWIADNNGTFSVASAWQLFRKKKQKSWQFPLTPNWDDFIKLMRSTILFEKSIIVKWTRPTPQFVKLNSDGSCKDGNYGGGGVIRDKYGYLVLAYSLPLGTDTSNWGRGICSALWH